MLRKTMSLSRDLTLKQLRAFAAVVRTGSVTKAADTLHVTPPAISAQLKTLRLLAGTDMLSKTVDGLKPTLAGEEVLSLFERIEAAVEASAYRVEALKAGRTGVVGVAVVSTGKYFAPAIIAAFMQAYPGIELKPLIGNRQTVLKALENRSVDLAIMGRPPAQLDVIAHDLGPHPHILIAPPGHALTANGGFDPEKLLAETMLLRELGSGTRALARRFMDQIGAGRSYATIEFGSNESIKQGVMAGLGIAMISEHTVLAELESERLVALDLPGLPIIRKWILVQPKGEDMSAAARSFHGFLIENREQLIPGHL